MLTLYLASMALGLFYAAGSLLLGGHGHGGADTQDASGHADHPSPFSPMVIAAGIASFGTAGAAASLSGALTGWFSLLISIPVSLAVSAAFFFGVVRLLWRSQSDSTHSMHELSGSSATVRVPIPAEGMGEISMVVRGQRTTFPAISYHHHAIPVNAAVAVVEFSGRVAVVAELEAFQDNSGVLSEDTDIIKRSTSFQHKNH